MDRKQVLDRVLGDLGLRELTREEAGAISGALDGDRCKDRICDCIDG